MFALSRVRLVASAAWPPRAHAVAGIRPSPSPWRDADTDGRVVTGECAAGPAEHSFTSRIFDIAIRFTFKAILRNRTRLRVPEPALQWRSPNR